MGSSSSVVADNSEHVVIIGGGYGGLLLAYKLLKRNQCKVTLVDPKDCMVHFVGALRSSVTPDFANKIFIPYQEVLGESFKRGKVVSIDTSLKTIKLDDDSVIEYSDLVISTGASSPFPGKINSKKFDISAEEGVEFYQNFYNEIKQSKKILIVGGGAVGVEMAGEIRTEFPESEITIINSREFLVSTRLNQSFQARLTEELKAKRIDVILNDKVTNMEELVLNKHQEDQEVKTKENKILKMDLVIPCVGNTVQTDFCKDSLGGSMTENGLIKVNEYLQVINYQNIFAIGDVNDVEEEKMAYTAKLQAAFLAENFKLKFEQKKLKTYKPSDLIMVLPIGKTGGVGFLKGVTIGNFLVKILKSKNLFTQQTWSDVGLKSP